MKKTSVFSLLKDTFRAWSEDKATRLASSTAYYTLFSLAPLLVIVIAVAGFIIGSQQAVQQQIHSQITAVAGPAVADAVQGMVSSSHKNNSDIIATIIGVVLLLVGASGVFSSLQDALNTIWEVKPDPKRGVKGTIFNRIFSFAMVLVIGFLLLVSQFASAAVSLIGTFFQNLLPAGASSLLLEGINLAVSFAVITLLFALVYKVLPDVDVNWRNVWIGAIFTSVLFVIGKELIGLYLAHSSVTSIYGAAGSLVVLLLWVYYAAMILYFGAEFTQVYAHAHGGEIKPKSGAVWMTAEDLSNQGITRQQPRQQPAAVPVTGPSRPADHPTPPSSALRFVPAFAVVGAGEGEREMRIPPDESLVPVTGQGIPPMPQPVRVLTLLVGALVAAIGVTGVLFTRSRPRRVDRRLEAQRTQLQEESRRLIEEAGRVRFQARQMHTATSRLDKMGDRLQDQSAKLRRASQKPV